MSVKSVVIVGGGLVGASLALMLQATAKSLGWRLILVEPHAPGTAFQPSYDARASAVAYGSRQILQRMGVWPALSERAEPIRHIHVSERGSFSAVNMSAEQEQVPALGYVIENAWMGQCFWAALDHAVVEWRCPARVERMQAVTDGYRMFLADGEELHADLAVLADGGRSELREQLGIAVETESYGQTALIANVSTSEAHAGRAFERFMEDGPVALLPMTEGRSVMIWTREQQEAQRLLALPDRAFLAQLQAAFGYRLGAFVQVGKRHAYPLALSRTTEQVRANLVVLGNAAHSLHPVAGQGFNLSLRDARCLADTLLARPDELGSLALLQAFQQRQRHDQALTTLFSDRLPRLFGAHAQWLGRARRMGLLGLELLGPAKRLLVQQAMGLGPRPD